MGASLVLGMRVSLSVRCLSSHVFFSRMNLFGGIIYALLASGDEQPWSEKRISIKYQMQFEANQFCFRKIDLDEVPILEGEIESQPEDETERANPNFTEEK